MEEKNTAGEPDQQRVQHKGGWLVLAGARRDLQAVQQLFKENRLARGEFVGLGKRLSLEDIICPVYLFAGDADDITPKEQVFDAEKYLGTSKQQIVKKLVPGGHIGLFMGTKTLAESWPAVAEWIGNIA